MTKGSNGKLTLDLNTGNKVEDVDCLLWAIGRIPNTDKICLDKTVSIVFCGPLGEYLILYRQNMPG